MKGDLCNLLPLTEINVPASSRSLVLTVSGSLLRLPPSHTLASHLSFPSLALSTGLSPHHHQPWSKDSGRFTHTQLHSLMAFLRSGAVIWKSHIEKCEVCIQVSARASLRVTGVKSSGYVYVCDGRRAANNHNFHELLTYCKFVLHNL